MSDLHNIQKTLADRLNAEYQDSDSHHDETVADHQVVELAERAQVKADAEEQAATEETQTSQKKSMQPFAIALVMFAFAAVTIAGEILT